MGTDRWLYAVAASTLAVSVAGLLVPLYIVQLGGGAPQLGLTAAVSSLVTAPGAVAAGRYADRTGNRRGVVVAGLAVAGLALAALPVIDTVPLVIAANALLAFALSAVGPVVTMLVVEDAPESAWNSRIGRLNAVQGYGGTLGFVVGTVWIVGVGRLLAPLATQRSLFVVAAAVGVAGAGLAVRWLPASGPATVGPRRSDQVSALLSRSGRGVNEAVFSFGRARFYWAVRSLRGQGIAAVRRRLPPALLGYFLAAALFFTGFGAFWAPLPLYLTDAGVGAGAVFGLYLLNNVGSTALYATAGAVATKRDARWVQLAALGVRGGCFLAFAGLVVFAADLAGIAGGTLAVVGGLLVLVGATWAFVAVTGTAIVSRLAGKATRGAILGVYAAVAAVGGAAGSLLGGLLAARGFELAFAASGLLVAAGAAVVLAVRGLSVSARGSSVTGSD